MKAVKKRNTCTHTVYGYQKTCAAWCVNRGFCWIIRNGFDEYENSCGIRHCPVGCKNVGTECEYCPIRVPF
jgi:hypothetical protein